MEDRKVDVRKMHSQHQPIFISDVIINKPRACSHNAPSLYRQKI